MRKFIEELREVRIDRAAYEALLAALDRVRLQWAGASVVDKRLAHHLCFMPPILRSAYSPGGSMAGNVELRDMANEIEAAVLACFEG